MMCHWPKYGRFWRNTTQPMCGVSAFYEELFPLVRKINQELPPAKRLRVLAADPPIDWSKVKSRDDLGQFMNRDVNIASVMQKEVLSKHRKALMLFGTAHLYHGDSRMGLTAVGLYERDYPGVTLVIGDHVGFGNWSPLAKYNDEFEARIASWPVPSLVPEMTGTFSESSPECGPIQASAFLSSLALCPFGYAVRSKGCSVALMHALAGHPLFQHLFIQSRNRFRVFWLPAEKD